jgi:hypothetical protein
MTDVKNLWYRSQVGFEGQLGRTVGRALDRQILSLKALGNLIY